MIKDPVNGEIRRLLTKADDALDTKSANVEGRLLTAYRKALDEVQSQIARLYKDSPNPTLADLRKGRRLVEIETRIADVIRDVTKQAVNMTHQSIREAFTSSVEATGEALTVGAGINLSFDHSVESALRQYVADASWIPDVKRWNGKLLTETEQAIERVLRENARFEIASGVIQGKPYSTIAKAIEERFNVAATRAKTITFTEMHKAHSAGRIDGIKRGAEAAAKIGVQVKKVWKHNHIGVPRPSHLRADNQAVDPGEKFNIGGVMMEAPGIGGGPEDVINCHCSAQLEVIGLEQEMAA
jgi:hypothetical protein